MLLNQRYTGPELSGMLGEAKYHLGRALYEGKKDSDLNQAVTELEEAVEMDPGNTAALFYLGQAIRAQVERNTLARAEKVLREYLVRGAPQGQEDEVRSFLQTRRQDQFTR